MKKRANRKRDNFIASTSTKAIHIVGIASVMRKSIEYHRKLSNNYSEAKVKAAYEFLEHYLKFDSAELNEIDIIDTQISGKGDDTLYVSMRDLNHVRDVHRRRAQVKNDDIHIINFIPFMPVSWP